MSATMSTSVITGVGPSDWHRNPSGGGLYTIVTAAGTGATSATLLIEGTNDITPSSPTVITLDTISFSSGSGPGTLEQATPVFNTMYFRINCTVYTGPFTLLKVDTAAGTVLPSSAGGSPATAANQALQLAQEITAATNSSAIAINSSNIASSTSTTATNTGSIATSTSNTATSVSAIAGASGTTADSAYAGSGTATVIAGLKGVYAAVKGSLNVRALSSSTDSVTAVLSGASVVSISGTVAVSAASLPLPSNAAQETGGNLATIATNTGSLATGVSTTATNTTAIAGASGTTSDAAYAGSGAASIISGLKGIYAAVKGTPAVSVSGSVAVTGTFWQATQPVSAASLPLPTNAAQETGGNLATIATNTGSDVTNTTAISAATGTTADAAYAGSGTASVVAGLKGVYAAVTGTLSTNLTQWSGTALTLANPLPQQMAGTYFSPSAGNTSTAQLAASATFTGAIESTLSQQNASLLITSDQPLTITIHEFIDGAGTYRTSNWVFTTTAGSSFSRAFDLNGNYFQLIVQNNGLATTTTLNINTYYGTIPATSQTGNISVSLADATIKAANTAAVATDPALVITQSPNSSADSAYALVNITTATPTTAWNTSGKSSLTVQINGTWSGSMRFEVSNDQTYWTPVSCLPVGEVAIIDTIVGSAMYTVTCTAQYMRLNPTSFTGTAAVYAFGRQGTQTAAADAISSAMNSRATGTPLGVEVISQPGPTGIPDTRVFGVISYFSSVSSGIAAAGSAVVIPLAQGQSRVLVSIPVNTLSQGLTLQGSIDGTAWYSIGNFYSVVNTTLSGTIGSGTSGMWEVPVAGLGFFRVICTTSPTGAASVFLTASVGGAMSSTQVNINSVGGTAVVNGGVAGTMAVGGNTAAGSTTTLNPITVAGVDSGALVRRLLTDTSGRPYANMQGLDSVGTSHTLLTDTSGRPYTNMQGLDPVGTSRTAGVLPPGMGSQNVASTQVMETSIHEGNTHVQLLGLLLNELQIMNWQLYELPRLINAGVTSSDEPGQLRNDQTFFQM